jgi:hypothetical protein
MLFSAPTTARYAAVAANAPRGYPGKSPTYADISQAAPTANPTDRKRKFPHNSW